MKDFDKEKLEQLLSDGKWDEAGNIITKFLSDSDESEERRKIDAALSLVYLDIMTKINEAYEASLNDAINQIKDLKEMSYRAKENASKRKVEASISKLQA